MTMTMTVVRWLIFSFRRHTIRRGENRTTSLRHESRAYIHANRIRGDSSVSLTYSGEYGGNRRGKEGESKERETADWNQKHGQRKQWARTRAGLNEI